MPTVTRKAALSAIKCQSKQTKDNSISDRSLEEIWSRHQESLPSGHRTTITPLLDIIQQDYSSLHIICQRKD